MSWLSLKCLPLSTVERGKHFLGLWFEMMGRLQRWVVMTSSFLHTNPILTMSFWCWTTMFGFSMFNGMLAVFPSLNSQFYTYSFTPQCWSKGHFLFASWLMDCTRIDVVLLQIVLGHSLSEARSCGDIRSSVSQIPWCTPDSIVVLVLPLHCWSLWQRQPKQRKVTHREDSWPWTQSTAYLYKVTGSWITLPTPTRLLSWDYKLVLSTFICHHACYNSFFCA